MAWWTQAPSAARSGSGRERTEHEVRYGWVIGTTEFKAGGLTWPADTISIVLVAGIIGIAALIALVLVEKARLRAGKIVIIDLRLFRIRSFGAGNIVALVVSLGEFGLLFTIPLFLQSVRFTTPPSSNSMATIVHSRR